MKKYAFIFSLLLSTTCFSQLNIVPAPAEVKMGKGITTINKNTKIVLFGGGLEKCSALLNEYLFISYGFKLAVTKKYASPNSITLNYERLDNDLAGAYNFIVDKKGIYIAGEAENGVFYGIQTLLQLITSKTNKQQPSTNQLSIPFVSIKDKPRFPYRGMHLDVGRHFFPVSFIKKYIDYLAAYKFNTFHWHLTEDQGWRIEIKKYPLLTQVGSCRDRTLIGNYGSGKYDSIKYCGYYTQAQIKEIVQYAADRYITVIPEIEMPGHSTAALASYPYLGCTKGPYKVMDTWGVLDDVYCAGNDSTFTFLQNVLDEVMQLFPSKYIHIGGDECPKERWKKCAACQKRMADNNLKDEHALQSYFIQRMEKYINSKGRNIIGWDEILEGGLAPNATVMSWRGEEGGIEAAKQNHDVIMTPGSHCYLDHSQSKNEDSITIGGYLPLEKVYSYEPIPAALNAEQAKHILGAQGNVWTEYIKNTSKIEYMIFPRMMALSEVLWSPKEKRDWNDFEKRLPTIFERLDKQKTNYSKAYYDLKATVLPTKNNDGVLWKVETKIKNITIMMYDGDEAKAKYEFSDLQNKILPKVTKFFNDTLTGNNNPEFSIKSNAVYSNLGEAKTFSARHLQADAVDEKRNITISKVAQKFYFNKATGKKITLVNQPDKSYPGDGAFTLVNGVQNEKGMARSSEFVGFSGTDLDATIDLGKDMEISKITVHCFAKNNSWIYLPGQIDVECIPYIDTTVITKHPPIETITLPVKDDNKIQTIKLPEPKTCRFVRVHVKNYGTIPAGKPGAGEKAWLFVDEIEVE
jgi:hexosaminidase